MPDADAFVVDASVVAELFLPGPKTKAAERFLGDAPRRYRLIAPRTVVAEVAAAIARGVRRGALKPSEARTAYSNWLQMLEDKLIEIVPDGDLLAPAFDLSLRLHHPLHDCIYVALAKSESAGIATCDTALVPKCRALRIRAEAITA
ncbi:MAG: type II toxin-antitoxin system VapC family toxin [Rhizomicrobium sp.]